MAEPVSTNTAHTEKKHAAASSVLAAVLLTGTKIVVGILTGSLGILAEAAHSALDLVAALMTLFAVRISDLPADKNHNYGHGKVENLSALLETVLLLATCVWIVYEAVDRLFFRRVDVEVTYWSFAVLALSIIVDASRSRMLSRTAKKYNSQALEADALHFSTDIWSSSVVILGLICVMAHRWLPSWKFLHEADAVAAILVVIIVIYISIRLGKRTILALIDTAPEGMENKIIRIVEAIQGVTDCHNVRLRYSGAQLFIDIHILTDGTQSLESAHELTEKIEKAIEKTVPNADVTVHPEPCTTINKREVL